MSIPPPPSTPPWASANGAVPPPPPMAQPYAPPTFVPAPSPSAIPWAPPSGNVVVVPRHGVNLLAIVTLVLAIVPWYGAFALFTGIPALNRMKTSGERGRIPTIVGLTFASLWALDWVMLGGPQGR